ncbi:MAG TPA: UbiA family prenyltransferase [Steroidobacteraceae bacterium]|nr:UbiA family prenyltransferase [Steroidobacteraceae bacterium]
MTSTCETHPPAAPSGIEGKRPGTLVLAALESLRPYQWIKNTLVFVPLAGAHRLGDIGLLTNALRAFLAFSLCASAVYLINDLQDAAADRLHPHKRSRPIASGRLPPACAVALIPVLLAGALAAAWPLGRCAAALALYVALMVAYSLWLKAMVLLDAFVLAGGYALRVIAGGLAVSIPPSPRLLAFCIFIFVSLALLKRYAELALLRVRDGANTHARGYLLEDQGFIVSLGIACGTLAVLVLAVYMSSENIGLLYSRSELIWLTCVLLLYWISHVWLAAHRGRMTDDPLVFAVKDRTSVALILLMGASAWLAV